MVFLYVKIASFLGDALISYENVRKPSKDRISEVNVDT
jgi:hypothetical protein